MRLHGSIDHPGPGARPIPSFSMLHHRVHAEWVNVQQAEKRAWVKVKSHCIIYSVYVCDH